MSVSYERKSRRNDNVIDLTVYSQVGQQELILLKFRDVIERIVNIHSIIALLKFDSKIYHKCFKIPIYTEIQLKVLLCSTILCL